MIIKQRNCGKTAPQRIKCSILLINSSFSSYHYSAAINTYLNLVLISNIDTAQAAAYVCHDLVLERMSDTTNAARLACKKIVLLPLL